MAQYTFGVGNMYATQLTDSLGNSVSNPTPFPLMVLQEGTIDISADVKQLYGQNQYAVAVGRGKASISVKVKPARILAGLWNAIFFGQGNTSGILTNFTDTVGAAIPTTPFQITVTPASSGTFAGDLGVIDSNGNPMTRVASAPVTGQYSVNTGTGAYTFAAADTGKTVYVNYQYTASTAGIGYKQTVNNQAMGYAPFFKADLTVAYSGKQVTFSFPRCMATKMNFGLKNEDFAVPEFEFMPMDNGSGQVYTWSTSE
jgi:hypothetical protein